MNDTANGGFVKLHRKMLHWGWYGDPAVKVVFLHLLLAAGFRDNTWNGLRLAPGQLVTSIQKLAATNGLSVQQVRTALRKLEATGEITRKSTNRYTLITLEKWAFYQLDSAPAPPAATDQSTNGQQTNNKPATNKQQQYKKGKKERKNTPALPDGQKRLLAAYAGEDHALLEALHDFAAMRRQQKKPMTGRALQMLLHRLDELAGQNGALKIKLLEQSILHCWLSVFPLKDEDGVREAKPRFLN